MIKRMVFLLSIVLIAHVGFAIDPIEFQVIRRFPVGEEERAFKYFSAPGMGTVPGFPRGFTVIGGDFFVDDIQNSRLVRVTVDGEWTVVRSSWVDGQGLLHNSKYLLGLDPSSNYRLVDLETNEMAGYGRFTTDYIGERAGFHYRDVVFIGDMIFAQVSSSDPQYHSFFFPENFDGQIEYRNPEETILFLKEEYAGTEQFRVDDEGYIFWEGRLVAPYGSSFYNFYYAGQPDSTMRNLLSGSQFIGWDSEGCTYWGYRRSVSVVDTNGKLIGDFYGENINADAKSQFTVTPEGTLYCLSYNADRDEFELMKLERFW